MDLPNWLVILAVVPPVILGAAYLIRDYQFGRYNAISLVVAFLYGMTVEVLSLHVQHEYAYANWWWMFSVRPNWVPYAIGISWASMVYVVMRTSDALGISWWQRPLFDGAAAMTIDLMLDPSMSSTRFVTELSAPCMNLPGKVEGGLSLWTWCIQTSPPAALPTPTWFTVPIQNFLGWWVVITMFSLVVRIGARYFKGETLSAPKQWLLLLVLGGVALGGCALIGPVEIKLSNGPAWVAYTMLAIVAALPFAIVLPQLKTLRMDQKFPSLRIAWPVYGYGCWGVLFFAMRLDRGEWPAAAFLMFATCAVGITLFLLPYLDALLKRRPPRA